MNIQGLSDIAVACAFARNQKWIPRAGSLRHFRCIFNPAGQGLRHPWRKVVGMTGDGDRTFAGTSEAVLYLPWHVWGEVVLFSLLLACVFHVLLDRNRRE
jgi:hypothetical protein